MRMDECTAVRINVRVDAGTDAGTSIRRGLPRKGLPIRLETGMPLGSFLYTLQLYTGHAVGDADVSHALGAAWGGECSQQGLPWHAHGRVCGHNYIGHNFIGQHYIGQ